MDPCISMSVILLDADDENFRQLFSDENGDVSDMFSNLFQKFIENILQTAIKKLLKKSPFL